MCAIPIYIILQVTSDTISKMASEIERVNSSLAINQFYQDKPITSEVVTGEDSNVVSKASSV
jgi:hypothetical protein